MSEEVWLITAMILVGLALIVWEIVNPGFFIAVPGTALVVLGGIAWAAPPLVFGGWGVVTWPAVAVASTGATILVYKRWAPPGDAPVTLSQDSLPGHEGRVTKRVLADQSVGRVRVQGQTFTASADEDIDEGVHVLIERVEGIVVHVRPVAATDDDADGTADGGEA